MALLLACQFAPADISGLPRLVIQFLMALLIISCVIQPRHALDRPLNLPPLRVLGIISYGMYLFHMWVLHMVSTAMVKGGVESPWLRFAGCLLLTAAVAGKATATLKCRS